MAVVPAAIPVISVTTGIFYAGGGGRGYPQANVPSTISVKDVMSYDLEWINHNETCLAAAQKMTQRNVGLLPVKDSQSGLLRGVITDRDLVLRVLARWLDASVTLVESVMSQPYVAMVYEDANLQDAERLMIDRGVRRLLVLRRSDNVIIGVVSVDDLALTGSRVRAGEVLRGAAKPANNLTPLGTIVPQAARDACVITTQDTIATNPQFFNSSIYTAADCMTTPVEWVNENDSCRVAAIRMLYKNIGCLPVASAGFPKQLVGVITDRDLVTRLMAKNLSADNTLIREVMSAEVFACFSDDDLADAERLMRAKCVRRLPVLNRTTNALCGLLSLDDIAVVASRSRAGAIVQSVASPAVAVIQQKQQQQQQLPQQQACQPQQNFGHQQPAANVAQNR